MPSFDSYWRLQEGHSPLIAAAVHDGHAVRAEIEPLLALDDAERLREEDPYTGDMAEVAPTSIIGLHSRFEVDFNRPREQCVYLTPDDAWGLQVWKSSLPAPFVEYSRACHDAFYAEMQGLLERVVARHGRFVVYDIHTYNHYRDGADAPPAPAEANPEVNIGTGTMNRTLWAPVVERFISDLRGYNFLGLPLDVRENVKFRGGYFPRWIHENFAASGCAIAIEFKKFWMDEWSGEADRIQVESIRQGLLATMPGVLEALAQQP